MRLAHAFKIDLEYRQHRKKLMDIKKTDARVRVTRSVNQNILKINSYHHKKSVSTYHNDYEKER